MTRLALVVVVFVAGVAVEYLRRGGTRAARRQTVIVARDAAGARRRGVAVEAARRIDGPG